MAVANIISNFTIISTCDTTTGWSGVGNTVDTEFYKQGAGALSSTLRSTGLNNRLYTWSGNLTNTHLRMWFAYGAIGSLATKANGGIRLTVSDGVNTGYWYLGGVDTYEGGWIILTIDTRRPFDSGTCDLTAVTQVGFTLNLLTAPKNAINTWWDFLVYGDGYNVHGGIVGDPITLDDIYATDRSLGYGVLRQFGGVYFLSSRMTIGSSTTADDTYFYDTDEILVYRDLPIHEDLYKLSAVGTATNSTSAGFLRFTLKSESMDNRFDLDLDDEYLDGVIFDHNDTIYCDQTLFKPTQTINDSIWRHSNMVEQNGAQYLNCNFTNSLDTSGAFHMTDGSLVDGCRFEENYVGVYLDEAGPYEFNDLHFHDNTYDINNGYTETVIVNLYGYGDASTYTGNMVIINNPITLTIEGLQIGSEVRIYENTPSPRTEIYGIESVVSSTFEYEYNYLADFYVIIVIFHVNYRPIFLENVLLSNTNNTIPVSQVYDRFYKES